MSCLMCYRNSWSFSNVSVFPCLLLFLSHEQSAGKYTVMVDYENGGAQELPVKSGDMVELVKEGEDGQWWEHRPFCCQSEHKHKNDTQ